MTLLNATTLLIETIKTHCLDDDPQVKRALKRMEKRLVILRLRRLQAHKRCQMNAFWDAVKTFGGGAVGEAGNREACITCQQCAKPILFVEFVKEGIFTGRGKIISLHCPHCSVTMTNSPDSELFLAPEYRTGQSSGIPQSHSSPAVHQPASHFSKVRTSAKG